MKRSTHWLVGESALSDEDRDHCRFCGAEVGREHQEGCAMRRRTVVVRHTLDLVVAVPEDASPDEVEAQYKNRCGSNVLSLLDLLQARRLERGFMKDGAIEAVRRFTMHNQTRMEAEGICFCGYVTAAFLREATEADEDAQVRAVNELNA